MTIGKRFKEVSMNLIDFMTEALPPPDKPLLHL